MYSYEDRGLAGDVKALRAVEVISINHCVLFCRRKCVRSQSVDISLVDDSDFTSLARGRTSMDPSNITMRNKDGERDTTK